MSEVTFEFPDSPGVEVTISRGGVDALTGEALPDQFCTVRWSPLVGAPQSRGFMGPE